MTIDTSTLNSQQNLPLPLDLKDVAVFTPALGTAIAFTFDVGFFLGLQVSFFTLFSLTEHITFSLIIIPFGILAASLFLVAIVFFHNTHSLRFRQFVRRISPVWLMYLMLATCFVTLAAFMTMSFLRAPLSLVIGLLTLATALGYYPLAGPERQTTTLVVAYSGVTALLATLSFGAFFGEAARANAPTRQLVRTDDAEVLGRVIRSGERGLLMFSNETKQLVFLKWDSIKNITTVN